MMVVAYPNPSSPVREDVMMRGDGFRSGAPGRPADHVQDTERYWGTTIMDSAGPVMVKTVVDDLPLFSWTINGAS
jgi:hypothetical protein